MNRPFSRTLVLLASCSLALPSLAAEKAENPVYKSWAGFKKGATVTYRSVSNIGDTKYESTMTYSLVELTRDKAVVEIQVTVNAGGKEVKNRPQKFDNPRNLTLPPGVRPEEFGKVQGLIGEGQETVKVGGREFQAKWYKAKGKVEAGDTFTHSWSSDEVPGGLIKSVVTTPANRSSMTMELVDLKLP